MSMDNIINASVTDEEMEKIKNFIKEMNEILKGKATSLSPEERRKYGSIGDKNKIIVDKCKFYMDTNPETIPSTIDKKAFDRDYKTRGQIESVSRELSLILEKLQDIKILLDYDNYSNANSYYRYVKFLASENHQDANAINNELKKSYQHSTRPETQKKEDDKKSEESNNM